MGDGLAKSGTIDREDIDLFQICDNADEVMKFILDAHRYGMPSTIK